MSLFSKKNQEVLLTPLGLNNPVTVQVLGICSALAVTAQLEPAIVMGLSVTIITAFANLVISLLRNTVPNRIRIIVQLVVVATLVTIVSEVLKAFAYDVSVQLSVYIGLIITNCILMGRLEAFAMMNGPWESFLDGIGNGLGYAKILIIVAFFRELFGAGTLLGFNILNHEWLQGLGYLNNGLMLMPPMALIICACVIWYQRAKHKELQESSNKSPINKEYGIFEFICKVHLCGQHDFRILLGDVFLPCSIEEREDSRRFGCCGYIRIDCNSTCKLLVGKLCIEG